MELLLILLLVAAIIAVVVLAHKLSAVAFQFQVYKDGETQRTHDLQMEHAELLNEYKAGEAIREEAARKESVNKSRAIHIGKIGENIAPFLPGFKYNPKDVQWVGGLFDLLVFEGRETGNITRVVFMDSKTGNAQLQRPQRQLRDTVNAGAVAFEIYRPDREWKFEEKDLL